MSPSEVQESREGEMRESVAHQSCYTNTELPDTRPTSRWVWFQDWGTRRLHNNRDRFIVMVTCEYLRCEGGGV